MNILIATDISNGGLPYIVVANVPQAQVLNGALTTALEPYTGWVTEVQGGNITEIATKYDALVVTHP